MCPLIKYNKIVNYFIYKYYMHIVQNFVGCMSNQIFMF